MSAHLLAIAVGPVQDFIVAARRTRDLWFGSHLLSEMSRAAADAIERYGTRIFPAPEPPRPENVANVILSELHADASPSDAVRDARRAVEDCWHAYAAEAREATSDLIREELWDEQVEGVVEFYAAWTDLPDGSYREARERVMRLLAARKACRDFDVPKAERPGVPKSSLDGARESVWKDPAHTPQVEGELSLRLRISPGEQLDVIGVTKRVGGGRKNYPSVSRIAADPWLRGAANTQPEAMEHLKAACEELAKAHRLGRANWPQFDAFPYEGTAVYKHRHKEIVEETHCPENALVPLRERLGALEKHCHEPEPYLAVLAADGDRMGRAISALSSADEHRSFSRLLAAFAAGAARIVRSHQGCLVYSGGDDVLAFLPLDQCLPCARELHEEFRKTMENCGAALPEQPTLSVGLGIGHFMDPLEDLLDYARVAEKAAKRPDRDGLAIHLHPRSGAPICIRRCWRDDPDLRIEHWAALLLSDGVSDKSAYDLRDLARDYQNWPAETDEEKSTLERAIRADAARLLSRKVRDREDTRVQELDRLIEAAKSADDLEDVAKEVLIARRIASAQRQASGGRS